MKPILMRMGCVGMLLLAAGIVDGAGSRPYSSQAFWPLLLLAMGVAVGGMGLGVRAELLDPGKDPETKRPRGASAGTSREQRNIPRQTQREYAGPHLSGAKTGERACPAPVGPATGGPVLQSKILL